jgi:hypothetical protein
MAINQTTQRFTDWRDGQKVSWLTIALFAVVIAYADGFVVTALQGVVGAKQRSAAPFGRWLRDSTLMLPLFFLAVLAAVLVARRWVGQSHHRVAKFAATALLIIGFGSGVGIAEVAASSAYDYHLQASELQQQEQQQGRTPEEAAQSASVDQTDAATCTGACTTQRATLNVHVRAVLYGTVVLLITNLVLVLWVLALRSDRLWRRSDGTPTSAASAVPQEWSVL